LLGARPCDALDEARAAVARLRSITVVVMDVSLYRNQELRALLLWSLREAAGEGELTPTRRPRVLRLADLPEG